MNLEIISSEGIVFQGEVTKGYFSRGAGVVYSIGGSCVFTFDISAGDY